MSLPLPGPAPSIDSSEKQERKFHPGFHYRLACREDIDGPSAVRDRVIAEWNQAALIQALLVTLTFTLYFEVPPAFEEDHAETAGDVYSAFMGISLLSSLFGIATSSLLVTQMGLTHLADTMWFLHKNLLWYTINLYILAVSIVSLLIAFLTHSYFLYGDIGKAITISGAVLGGLYMFMFVTIDVARIDHLKSKYEHLIPPNYYKSLTERMLMTFTYY